MKVTINVTRMITEEYEVDVHVPTLREELGISPTEYNDDREGALADYIEGNLDELLSDGKMLDRYVGDDDEFEFQEVLVS